MGLKQKNLFYYQWIVTFLISCWSIIVSIFNSRSQSAFFNQISAGITILLLVLGVIINIIYNLNLSKIVYILILIAGLIYWHNYFILNIISFTIALLPIYKNNYIKMYQWILGSQLICGLLISLLTKTNVTNPLTGGLTLGYINENSLGAELSLFFLFLVINKNDNNLKLSSQKWKYTILTIVILFVYFVLNDMTACAMIILFFIFYFIFRIINDRNKWVIGTISFFLPIVICMFSIWVGYNFSYNNNFLVKLDNLVTLRPLIWNHYFMTFPIGANPSSWVPEYNFINGSLDGTYAYLYIFLGYIILMIITVGFALCNFRLAKKKDWVLLSLMLAIEIASFSENISINLQQCFASVFSLLSYYLFWNYNSKQERDI